MVEHVSIAIGIDRYEHLQPLRYAQTDAGAFQRCVATAAAIPDSQSWLLAETAPKRSGDSTYPTRENIERSIAQLSALDLQPEDILWCFFCGYGVNFLGKDYLMPIDGNPQEIQETGISVESFLDRLKQAKTKNVRVFLDISRPTGKYAGAGIGSETLELAAKFEIAVMLSCQPDQFSHETSALDGGLFTAALVEALNSKKCPTWESLERYMRDRLPQLCDHHWRPKQDPVTIVSQDEQLHQFLFRAEEITTPGKDRLEIQPPSTSTQEPLPHLKATTSANLVWERWLWFGGLAATILLLGVLLAHDISSKDRSPSQESSDTSQSPSIHPLESSLPI